MSNTPLQTLSDIKIIAFTHFLMGPAGVQYLADLGADVIKIESLEGAAERHAAPADLYLNGETLLCLVAQRNIRSIALDLKSTEGAEIARRLIEKADVLVVNFRAGVMDRLGLGYEHLREINPQLVYVACSGYGEKSLYRDLPGQDLLIQSRSGMAFVTGTKDSPPTPVGAAIVDQHGAALVALGTLAALRERDRAGKGQKIEVTLMQAALDLQQENICFHLNGHKFDRAPRNMATDIYSAPYGIFETKDSYITISICPVAKLQQVMDLRELEPYKDPALSYKERKKINEILAREFLKRTTQEWLDLLLAENIWCAPVLNYDEVFADPAVAALNPVIEIQHPQAGRVKLLRHPISYEAGTIVVNRPPPMLGEHTIEILQQYGYSTEEIIELQKKNVIRNT